MTEKNAEKTTPPSPAEPQKPRRTNWAVWVLAIVMIFLLGSGTALYFLPVLKTRLPVLTRWIGEENSLESDISVLESRLSQQETALQTLEEAKNEISLRLDNLPNINAPAETDSGLKERLDKLEQAALAQEKPAGDMAQSARIDMLLGRMSQLEASFIPLSKGLSEAQEARLERSRLGEKTTAQSGRLDLVESRLDAVERYAARDNSGALLAFRISDLRRKVTSGQAFGPEIAALETMISHGSLAVNDALQESISWLKQHKDGIIPPDRLRGQFDALIPALIRAKSGHKDDPWWQRAYNSGKNLVMIRKTETSDKGGSDSIIANIQQGLARLDLRQALDQLGQLSDTMREILVSWIKRAKIYLQAGDHLNRIESLTAGYYLDSADKISSPEPYREEQGS